MSKEIINIECLTPINTKPNEIRDLAVTTFYGGSKHGKCVQLAIHNGKNGFVHLNEEQASQLVHKLAKAFKIHIVNKTVLTFVGIDDWGRVIFKDAKGNYYGDVNNIFGGNDTVEDMSNIITEKTVVYFGRAFNCEPDGSALNPNLITLKWHK